MNTAHKPVWAGTHMRLDPFRLPQIVSYASSDDNGDVLMTIDTRAVVIKRKLPKSGLPFTIALPSKAFKGVAARAIDDGAVPGGASGRAEDRTRRRQHPPVLRGRVGDLRPWQRRRRRRSAGAAS